jgi:HEAT repeats
VQALAFLALGMAAAALLLLLVFVARRSWHVRRQRRREAYVAAIRPVALGLIEGEGPEPPVLRGEEAETFAELLSTYGRVVSGDSRRRIVAYFESTGAVDEQHVRLTSRRAWRRATAAFALGDMGSERAVPWLLDALDDKNRDVRAAAIRSLGRIGSVDAIEPLVTAGVESRAPDDVTRLALLDIGGAAVPRLLELVDHPEPGVRAAVIELVGIMGTASDAASLRDGLHDTAADVRAATAGALGRLGAADARDALIDALGDRVPQVRAAAAKALGQIRGQEALDALLPVARSDRYEPARAAAHALARIDPAVVLQAAESPDAGPHLVEAADLARL